MKILKNQIQNTLLEIQTEIMNHYYTSLRADDDLQGTRTTGTHGGGAAHEGNSQAPSQPNWRQNSAEKTQASINTPTLPNSAAAQDKPAEPPIREMPQDPEGRRDGYPVDWASFARLTKWVSKTAEQIGAANTRKVIETCRAQGLGNDHMLESLFAFLFTEDAEKDATRDPVPIDQVLTALAQLTELLAGESQDSA
ncbi:MAG: hypothetical protein U9R48_07005 [Chloroflexota bacterium]|nr:hypothetical protein [Chloroflexota bacterium]